MSKDSRWQGGLFSSEDRPPVKNFGAEDISDFFSEDLTNEPLSSRMRPRSLEEYAGQEHLIGPGKVLRRLLESDSVPSVILWGPPGTGKTSLAKIISLKTKAAFSVISAVSSGVSDVRRAVSDAKERWRLFRKKTLLFIDEIHRFNKGQQDSLLPYVEDGTVILVGATTENPSFQVISPLISRCRVLQLHALDKDDILKLLRRALTDKERGLGNYSVKADDEFLEMLAEASGGDARSALNNLEEAVNAVRSRNGEAAELNAESLSEILGRRTLRHDRSGDSHYDIISALIKSVRGSDPDGALFWLARLLESGEDPMFVARRLVILASEDVGLADPQALNIAVSAQQAAHFIGMPEGFYPLAEAALYLALAPKSNSIKLSYNSAREALKRFPGASVPLHLRNAPTKLMEACGYSKGYKYAHDYPEHFVKQQFLPDELKNEHFYVPGSLGYEKRLADWLSHLKNTH